MWTENADGTGAVNFITGMGGFLQSVLFGYGGFRLHPDRIEFQGRLPPSTTSFNVTGLDYLGGSIDFSFLEDISIVKLTKRAKYPLKLKYDDSKVVQLVENEEQTITAQRAFIVPDFPPLPIKTTSASADGRNAAVGNSLTLVRISLYLFIMTMFVME